MPLSLLKGLLEEKGLIKLKSSLFRLRVERQTVLIQAKKSGYMPENFEMILTKCLGLTQY